MTSACGVCKIHTNELLDELVAWESDRWILRHHPAPAPLVGWFLLDTRRHVASAADFDALEEAEFAQILGSAMRAIRSVIAVPRVYIILFGEGAQHVHAHLIPRDPSHTGTSAWEIADWYRAVESGKRAAAQPVEIAEAVQRVREEMRTTVKI
ncbi:MAG: diadenosine tetraphosphate hydrolase [Planctomycetota bacterium]|nr:diadenosine tetraphosphate hydrolase [Planctomycetota bacterium]